MQSLKIRLRGEDTPVSSQPGLDHFELTRSILIQPQTRADAPVIEMEVKENDFLEIVLDDGTVRFGNHEIPDSLFPGNDLTIRRDNPVWVMPSDLETVTYRP